MYFMVLPMLFYAWPNNADWGSDRTLQTCYFPEILKVVNAVNMFVLFFCPCCANFWAISTAVLREAINCEKKDFL